jgi:hypothetical protein
MTATIEWSLLGDVIWQSLVAGIGVTALFSLVVFGSSRAAEARREGANPTIYGALALASLLAVAGVVVFAITVILNKA